jgi:hypothetical protein
MTIQPTSQYNPYSEVSNASQKSAPQAASQSSHEQAPDTVQLSAHAKASFDADHDGDSH